MGRRVLITGLGTFWGGRVAQAVSAEGVSITPADAWAALLDGRTILLDWAYPGSGPALWDLAWYLALNSARLPIDKEATIAAFQDALERRGVRTSGWFDLQLDLCLLGMTACFGWEKAMGADDELCHASPCLLTLLAAAICWLPRVAARHYSPTLGLY